MTISEKELRQELTPQKRKLFKRKKPKCPKKRAISFLNITQSLGVLNDNIFKFFAIYLLIDHFGHAHSATISFWIGLAYVIPFLIFSSFGGTLADKYSKQRVIIWLKVMELAVMGFGVLAFWTKSPVMCFTLAFLMALQSALFAPPKYSIIPELIELDQISKVNGLMTSSTYIGIILGSTIASAITLFTGKNFILGALFCCFLSAIGLYTSLRIPKTQKPKKRKKALPPFFLTDVYMTLKECSKERYLVLAIFSSAFFMFIGAFIQLNIITYTIQTLKINEAYAGYLFTTASIGIVLGAFIAGRSSKQTNIGLSCASILAVSCLFFSLYFSSFSIPLVIANLILLGFTGGMYIIPIDSFIQSRSPEHIRGKIIATLNFLSFCGAFMAPVSIKVFNGMLDLDPSLSFIMMGVICAGMSLLLARKFSALFFNFLSRKMVYPFMKVKVFPSGFKPVHAKGCVLLQKNWISTLILLAFSQKLKFYVVQEKPHFSHKLLKFFKSVRFLYSYQSFMIASNQFKHIVESNNRNHELPCLLIPQSVAHLYVGDEEYAMGIDSLKGSCHFIYSELKSLGTGSRRVRDRFKRKQISFYFEQANSSSVAAPNQSIFAGSAKRS